MFTRVDMSKRYDNIHQHDVLGYNYPLKVQPRSGSVWFANVFPVKTRHGEILKAVSFYTLTGNTKYEVRLVTNFTGPASLSGGIKVAEGTLASAGYHTIDLDSNTNLSYGSSFAVVVRLTAKGIREIAADSAKGWSVKNSVSQAGESFVRVNSSWRDLHWIEPNTNVCLKAFTVDAPVPASELMNPADMLAELEYVLGRMRADNPAVRRSGFSAEQLATIDDVRASISFPLSRQDYYFQLQRAFAMLGECQTNIWTSPSESFYLNLPFVWLMDDGIVIQQDAAPLAKGDTVLSIGGAAPDQLIRMLSRIVSAENEYWLRHTARSVLQRGSYLDYFGLVNPDRTVDVAILREGKAKVYRIPLGRSYPGPYERPVITWRIEEENNLGYLRFDVFPHRDEMASLLQEIDSFFGAVRQKGIPNIVIDWRYAGGGYAHVLHDFLGYFEGGPIYIEGHRLYDITKRPEGETFKGSTYVLTSNRTFGATVIGAMLLHDNGIGVTVGEPIGAKPNFSGSNRSDERLPVTGWTARISNLAPMRPRDFDSTATTLEPDIPVYTSHDDFMAGRDPQMELVRRMCTGKF